MSHRIRWSAFLVLCGLVVGCANTGVVSIDGGAYMIAIRSPKVGFSAADDEKAEAYKEANAHCAGQGGKKVETIKLTMVDAGLARSASASLDFKCVP